MPAPHRTDRRVRRTREALTRALIELILEKGFDATNVSDIVERADVGRSTFYVHYADKEDLLQGSIEGLREHLERQMQPAPPRTARRGRAAAVHPALAFCLPMLEHGSENRDLFAAMVGRRSSLFFQELMHEMWAEIIRSSWAGADELTVQALVGAFGSTVSWWLSRAPELSPEEVERRFRAVVEPGLRRLAPHASTR